MFVLHYMHMHDSDSLPCKDGTGHVDLQRQI